MCQEELKSSLPPHLINGRALVPGPDVVLDQSVQGRRDRPWQVPPGCVVARWGETGRYVLADDARADRSQPASVTSLQPVSPGWGGGSLTLSVCVGLGFTIDLARGTRCAYDVIDQLNAHFGFRMQFMAHPIDGGRVRIRTRGVGSLVYVHVVGNSAAMFGPAGIASQGRDGDYLVTHEPAVVQDDSGRPIHAVVATLVSGHFNEPALRHLTSEAREVLVERGSLFGGDWRGMCFNGRSR